MAWLMVALIGPGKGPRIPVTRKKSVLRVSGHCDGVVRAYLDEVLHVSVECDGNFSLPEGEFVCVEYEGKSRSLIAEIVRET